MRKLFNLILCSSMIVFALGLDKGLAAQDLIPEGLKDKALSIRIQAAVVSGPSTAAWHSESQRYTMPGTPVGVKLVGSNVIILVRITPYDDGKGGLVLVTQGQVWVKGNDGDLSYRTTLDTIQVRYGEKFYIFPLGRLPNGEAPMSLQILVDHYVQNGGSADDQSKIRGSDPDPNSASPPPLPKGQNPQPPASSPPPASTGTDPAMGAPRK